MCFHVATQLAQAFGWSFDPHASSFLFFLASHFGRSWCFALFVEKVFSHVIPGSAEGADNMHSTNGAEGQHLAAWAQFEDVD